MRLAWSLIKQQRKVLYDFHMLHALLIFRALTAWRSAHHICCFLAGTIHAEFFLATFRLLHFVRLIIVAGAAASNKRWAYLPALIITPTRELALQIRCAHPWCSHMLSLLS